MGATVYSKSFIERTAIHVLELAGLFFFQIDANYVVQALK